MPFSMSKMGHLSPMLLLLLMMASVCIASQQPKHICQYDEMRKDDPILHVIQNLPTGGNSRTQTVSVISEEDWKPIRILVSFNQLNDAEKECSMDIHETTEGYSNGRDCKPNTVITEQQKKDMKRVVHSAVKVHSSRLKVIPRTNGFALPYFHSGLCSRLHIPNEHHRNGVKDTDMVLYVSHMQFPLGSSYGYGFPCAIDKMNHRPLVGGLLLNAKHIIATDYTVRVLAHEIAHALGFDIEIMKKKRLIEPKLNVRGKDKVHEFRGKKVVQKVKDHYRCDAATGMELEDEVKVRSNAKMASLWESRNAKDELMAGIVRKGLYTNFTLAFFEDLGCYKADYSKAEQMDWGYKMGCDFLTKKCIENGVSNFPTTFCTEKESNALFCTSGGRTMGKCIGLVTDELNPYPSSLQYFSDKKMTAVSYLLTDQCPYIEDEDGADCRNKETFALSGVRGDKSWCLPRAREETKITPEGHRGVCAQVTDNTNDPEYIFNSDGSKTACVDEQTPLTAPEPFNGMQLNCPPSELLIRKNIEKNVSFLISESEVSTEIETPKHEGTENTPIEPITPSEVEINEENDPRPTQLGQQLPISDMLPNVPEQ